MFCRRRATQVESLDHVAVGDSSSGITDVAAQDSSFPIEASSTGKRFYTFTTRAQCRGCWNGVLTPFVVYGHRNAIAWLGGSWSGRGTAPRGFIELDGALGHIERITGCRSVTIHWAPPKVDEYQG